jgi:predicted nucleic acid-binding protein
MKYLVDSNIFIYHLNGEARATKFLINNINECALSWITYIEVLSFSFTIEQKKNVKAFLEKFIIMDITGNIAKQAVENRNNKKIKIADNIIASTAQVNDLVLVTRNVSDFRSIDISILEIFENK